MVADNRRNKQPNRDDSDCRTPEDLFRLWAFHTAYRGLDDEHDLGARFMKAIQLSSQPVPKGTADKWLVTIQHLRQLVRDRFATPAAERVCVEDYIAEAQKIIRRHMGIEITWRAWELDGMAGLLDEMAVEA